MCVLCHGDYFVGSKPHFHGGVTRHTLLIPDLKPSPLGTRGKSPIGKSSVGRSERSRNSPSKDRGQRQGSELPRCPPELLRAAPPPGLCRKGEIKMLPPSPARVHRDTPQRDLLKSRGRKRSLGPKRLCDRHTCHLLKPRSFIGKT